MKGFIEYTTMMSEKLFLLKLKDSIYTPFVKSFSIQSSKNKTTRIPDSLQKLVKCSVGFSYRHRHSAISSGRDDPSPHRASQNDDASTASWMISTPLSRPPASTKIFFTTFHT